jgi:hypothetical protein
MPKAVKETDLFPPVRDYLTGLGYSTYAEVKSCDVVGIRDDDLAIVELKTSLNLTVVRQAVDLQNLSRAVYIAIPEPARFNRAFRGSEKVLKRLGLGLLTVYLSPLRSAARLRFDPTYEGRLNQRLRNAVLKEVSGRTLDLNQGGSSGVTIYTAYRESAFTIAWLLNRHGPMLIRELRPYFAGQGTADRLQPLLANNHYGWFRRVKRGCYEVTETGRQALDEHPDLSDIAEKRLLP